MNAHHIFIRIILLSLLTILAACSSGGDQVLETYLESNQADLLRPASVDTRPVMFVVEPGTPARVIGTNLQEAGLIKDDLLFEAYVRVNGIAARLNAGTFILAPSMTIVEIVEALQKSEAASVTITIPEGWRLEQIAEHLAEIEIFADTSAADTPPTDSDDTSTTVSDDAADETTIGAEQYRQQAEMGDLSGLDPSRYPFLAERPAGSSLEGYLFPDTYKVPAIGTTPVDVLERQLDSFAAKVLPAYNAALEAGTTDMDLYSVLTLASIVEREAVIPEERPAIATVYLNRLESGIPLEADPTVQYAMGYQPESGQWWKTPVFLEEYSSIISPYNTYLNYGLPPGPIASPGLSSIEAVLNPDDHSYLYFVAIPDGTGAHVFAETFEEHSVNVQKYLTGQ